MAAVANQTTTIPRLNQLILCELFNCDQQHNGHLRNTEPIFTVYLTGFLLKMSKTGLADFYRILTQILGSN
jgi:hypothetical protein